MKSLPVNETYLRFRQRYLHPGAVVMFSLFCLLLVLPAPGAYGTAPIAEDHRTEGKIDSGPALAESERSPGWAYNSDYIFALSRAVRDSGLAEAGKVPLFIPSIIIDTAFLPVALIAGLLG